MGDSCSRCQQSAPDVESNDLLYWEADENGRWICPNCITSEESQLIADDAMATAEETEKLLAAQIASEERRDAAVIADMERQVSDFR